MPPTSHRVATITSTALSALEARQLPVDGDAGQGHDGLPCARQLDTMSGGEGLMAYFSERYDRHLGHRA
jgi:hypothetical protein